MSQSRDNLSLLPKLEKGRLENMFERWVWYVYDRTFFDYGVTTLSQQIKVAGHREALLAISWFQVFP